MLLVQATAKLSAAEGAGSAAERDALVAEALQGLLAVPQCVNLAEFVPRLAFLRQYKVSQQSLVQCVTPCACGQNHAALCCYGQMLLLRN